MPQLNLESFSSKAQYEIGEANSDLEAQLSIVTNILREKYSDLRLPPDFDGFLLRCLRARKFDTNKAAKLVSQYFKLMHDLSDMHSSLIPSTYKDLYTSMGMSELKFRDSEGRSVLLARQELVPASDYTFDQSLAAFILMFDEVNRCSVDTQRIGVVLICDMKGYSFAHLRQTNPSRLRAAAKLFQDAFPARLKAVHFVRNPFLVGCFYSIVKPFLREKLQNRIKFHGYDLETLHKHVSPTILPQYLGGKLPNDNYSNKDLTSGLVKSDEYFKTILRHGYYS